MALEIYWVLGNFRVFTNFNYNTKMMLFEPVLILILVPKKFHFGIRFKKNKKHEMTSFQLQTLNISRSPF